MTMKLNKTFRALGVLSVLFISVSIFAKDPQKTVTLKPAVNKYAFVQLGKLKLEDSSSKITSEEGESLEGEFDDLPWFSGGVQTLIGNGYFRYGYEAGALVSWQNDSVSYYGTNNQVAVVIDNQFWMFSGFLGAMGEINFKDRVRVFISAGPTLGFASISQDDDDPRPEPSTKSTYVNGQKREFSGVYGAYASAGLIINFSQNTELGLVYRDQVMNIDFSSDVAQPEYDGRQVMVSFGYKM